MALRDPAKWLMRGIFVLFFCVLCFLSFFVPGMFVSPDENANAFFANIWATQKVLFVEETANVSLQGLLHPRSILAQGSFLIPGSFLGFPVLAGSFAAFFGPIALFLFTPLLAVLSVLALRSMIFFASKDQWMADIGALFFLLHPAFWYYASRPFMHNVPFLAFLLFALWFAWVAPSFFPQRRPVVFFLSGACLAFALAVRTSEALWIAPGCLVFFVLIRKTFSWKELVFWISGCVTAFAPFMAWNHVLYGSFLQTGYTVGREIVPMASSTPSALPTPSRSWLLEIFFPFGFQLLRSGKHALY
jgi:hypothetical protein